MRWTTATISAQVQALGIRRLDGAFPCTSMSTLTRVACSHARFLRVSASSNCVPALSIRPWTQVHVRGSYPLQFIRSKKTRGVDTPKASKQKSAPNAPTKDDPEFKEEVAKMEPKMVKIESMFTSEMALLESRVTGRALPTFVENLSVQGLGKDEVRPLKEVATIGVRDGNTLLVTAFEEKVKHKCLCSASRTYWKL